MPEDTERGGFCQIGGPGAVFFWRQVDPTAPRACASSNCKPTPCQPRTPGIGFADGNHGEKRGGDGVQQRRHPDKPQVLRGQTAGTKQFNDLIHKVQDSKGDFVLLDTRTREAFAQGHIRGAWCAPLAELPALAKGLPKDRELVTYCWKSR